MKIMASGPITSWEIDVETVETVSDFIFLGSKFTADGDCSHEIKRRLLLGSTLKGETVPDSLPATPKSPPTRRVPPRGNPEIPAFPGEEY